ncbi:PDR/VanB family oxidoreductase [Hydrogenophaga sp. 2FB]|uniref:PDR/VanB family oxidoreductase n=1 Tax=Hydrogenophaga sp. 2FB TaxID=2502187 RepID=UPI0014857B49|nr:PDR/VanB family oxidoreductase [Hydrogenophaga sp. 2FB]
MKRRPFVVRRKWETAEGVFGFELVPEDGLPLDRTEPGAHVEFILQRAGLPTLTRHYSLCNAPDETDAYVFGVKKETLSRGGSRHLHALQVGGRIVLGSTHNHFPLAREGSSHLLLAGGIGITPLLAMMQKLSLLEKAYELHYFVRGPSHVAFLDRLETARLEGRLHIHAGLDGAQTRKVLEEVLQPPGSDAHAYCCGPGAFMAAVEDIAAHRWPTEHLHFERFQADDSALARPERPFTVVMHKTGMRCDVHVGETIVGAMARAGIDLDTSCEQGVCGTCLTRVLEGTPDHRDAYLSNAERLSNTHILPCVSRSHTPVLVLDR